MMKRQKNKKGQIEISFMTVIEVAFTVLVFLTIYNIYDTVSDNRRITEKAVAQDAALLIDAMHAVPHGITYVYPQTTPGNNITITKTNLHVHAKTLSARNVERTGATFGYFWRSKTVDMDIYSSVDGGLFLLSRSEKGIALREGVSALQESKNTFESTIQTLRKEDVRLQFVANEQDLTTRNTLRELRSQLEQQLGEQDTRAPHVITVYVDFGEFALVEYGTAHEEVNRQIATTIAGSLLPQLAVPTTALSTQQADDTITITISATQQAFVDENAVVIASGIIAQLQGLII